MEVFYNSTKENLIFVPLRCGTTFLHRYAQEFGIISFGDLGPIASRKSFISHYIHNTQSKCTVLLRDPFYRLLSVYNAFTYNMKHMEHRGNQAVFWDNIPEFLSEIEPRLTTDAHVIPQRIMLEQWEFTNFDRKNVEYVNVANYADWIFQEFNFHVPSGESEVTNYIKHFSGDVYIAMMFYDFVKTHYADDYKLMNSKGILPGFGARPSSYTTSIYAGRTVLKQEISEDIHVEDVPEDIHVDLEDVLDVNDVANSITDIEGEEEHEHFNVRLTSQVSCMDGMSSDVPLTDTKKKPKVRVYPKGKKR